MFMNVCRDSCRMFFDLVFVKVDTSQSLGTVEEIFLIEFWMPERENVELKYSRRDDSSAQ